MLPLSAKYVQARELSFFAACRNHVILGAVLFVYFVSANAAETTFNGFASFAGGMTVSSTELPDGSDTTYRADPGNSTNPDGSGAINEKAFYTDTISYRPDSSYGLQVKSDLTRGLTVTAQVTGRGANGFQADLEWAYMSYELTPNFVFQAGRQRMPLYYYSDFIDVGYAYHWIRPPADVYANTLPTYEGISFTHNGAFGDWSTSTRFYTGMSKNEQSSFGSFTTDSVYGFVFNISNDWLQIRASYLLGEFYTAGLTDKSNPEDANFGSLAANLTLGDGFIITEITTGTIEDRFLSAGPLNLDALGSSMISAGYLIGSVTPHITYSDSYQDFYDGLVPIFEGESLKRESLTAGIRWDFHPAAAFKVEYTSTTDKSTEIPISLRGKANEVDVVTVGFDLIF